MTSETHDLLRQAAFSRRHHSETDSDQQKENHDPVFSGYRHRAKPESSDDDFDEFLVERATPKGKTTLHKQCSAKKNSSHVVSVSSDSDGGFENFLHCMKTPKAKPQKTPSVNTEDSLKNFIVADFSSDDDFIQKKPSRAPKSSRTPVSLASLRTPLSQCDSPVFLSDDSDDDDSIVVKSTWRTRHKKPQGPTRTHKPSDVASLDEDEGSPLVFQSPLPLPPPRLPALQVPPHRPSTQLSVPLAPHTRIHSAPPKFDDSSSSEEEFASLLERLKRKNLVGGGTPAANRNTENQWKRPVSIPAVKVPATKSAEHTPVDFKTPGRSAIPKPTVSQTEPRPDPQSRGPTCKTPGCFLQSLSVPGSIHGHNFKQTKESLTSRLYQLYNTSVFDGKLPTDMSVTWNKKMRKTAGYCISGQERGGGKRYTRIELSEKVCDSADRLRDTLVHEMCHAATWLINGVRDGHGSFWKLYARKATLAHPELPMVTRCHSYDIKYKFQYQCTRCKNTIGRHSKSLDTQKFVCALCTGPLVLLAPANTRAPAPFANFVKENYGTVRQELVGKSHADVMRKLSADFASKTKLSQS